MVATAGIARTRHRLGNGGRAGRALLAGDRWVQSPSFSSVHWRTGGRPVAAHGRVMRRDDCAGAGIHLPIRRRQHDPVRSWTPARSGEPDLRRGLQQRQSARSKHELERSDEQTRLAPFWEGNASVHWNQAANQIARARQLSISASNRLLAVLNIAMADTAFTIWSAKRHYGSGLHRGHMAAGYGDPAGRHRRQSGHGCRRGLAAAGQLRPATPNILPATRVRMARRRPSPQPLRRSARRSR